jgi:N-acetyl-gamma-glutamyl-phosphate reductase
MTDTLKIGVVKVGIVGVSGYGGGELARLLLAHPNAELAYVTSETYAGKPLGAALPGLAPGVSLTCESFDPAVCAEQCDFVFLAGEAGLAMRAAPALLEAGVKIVDLSADFRLEDPEVYARWYQAKHTASHLLDEAVYGLPELNKIAIETARLVANPGCHVTAAVLALAPLLSAGMIAPETIIIDSLSGVSGAGRSKFGLDYHFAEINESMKPYGVGGVHRHIPEIEQALSFVAESPVTVTFTPHLVPVTRGILSTVYASTEETEDDLRSAFTEFYADAPFVSLCEAGQFPATKPVFGTNFCRIGLALDPRAGRVVVIAAIDNLVKGAAGQAVQNMNLMCGFSETVGLEASAVWP